MPNTIDPVEIYHRRLTRAAIACGLWAGLAISIARHFVHTDNVWLVASISLGPGLALAIIAIIRD